MSTEQVLNQDNADQIKYWNGDAGDKWVRFADRLDALLSPFAPLILERATLQAGERVLDIGCGGGALSLAAEEQVAPDGGVTGVDVSAPLLELARQRSANIGGNSAFVEADAAQYRSSIPLDAAVSRFGVMFFSDPAAAFLSLRRSFHPEARLVFVCWQGLSENAWARAPLEAAMPHFTKPLPTPDPHAPGPFAFADRDRVQSILGDAGWRGVEIEPWAGDLHLPGDTVLESASFMMELGPVARLLKEQDLEETPVLDTLESRLAEHTDDGGRVSLEGKAWLVSAVA